jgi:DNA mismatch repair ATPase MutS
MPGAIKYVKDETGQKTSVLVPVKVWDDLNSNYKKLRKKLKAISDIHQALNEVHQARKSGKKLQTLKAFLSENNS